MKKMLLVLVFIFIPAFASADRACPDYCANGNFYYRGSQDMSGVCIYPSKQSCEYGCDGRDKCLEGKECPAKCEDGTYFYRGSFSASTKDCQYAEKKCEYSCDGEGKCLEGKDCPAKCENGIYYYRGSFSVSTKDCQYTEKKCDYGCGSRECADAPPVRKCDDYCQSGNFYSTGSYNTLLKKCEYENKEKCVCDSAGEKCIDVDCSSRCSNGVAYFDGKPTADGKCKYKKEEKCENGCNNEGIDCLGVCRSRCSNGNYYYNGSYQSMNADTKNCVFDELKCPIGCESDSDGCKRCQKDSDCWGQNYCDGGSMVVGWCAADWSSEELESHWLEPKYVESNGCMYNLITPCNGGCNPFYKNMCSITIGPVVYEDPADSELKPILGAKVKAFWKTSDEEVSLPERTSNENGNVYFSDEEKYKFFPDESAKLFIIVTLENFEDKSNAFPGEAIPSITRIVDVGDKMTYNVNLSFAPLKSWNDLYMEYWEAKAKEKSSVRSVMESMTHATSATGNWLKGKMDVIGRFFGRP